MLSYPWSVKTQLLPVLDRGYFASPISPARIVKLCLLLIVLAL